MTKLLDLHQIDRFLTVLISLAFAVAAQSMAAAAPNNVYMVAGVKVDAVASNAVEAKTRAVAEGEVRALRTLLKRLSKYTDYSKLPEVDTRLSRSMLDNISFVRERNSRTRYIATLNYSFQENNIRRLLRDRGISFLDRQAPRTVIVPAAGAAPDDPMPKLWREALAALDLAHSVAPVRLADARPVPAGAMPGMSELSKLHDTDRVLLAMASVAPDGTHLKVELSGQDAVGPFNSVQTVRIYDGDQATALAMAAAVTLKIIEGRWKSSRLGLGDDADAAAGALATQGSDKVVMTVLYSGLPEWVAMRRKLENLSGVHDMNPGSVSPRGATVTLSYPGGAGRLARDVQRAGLFLENRGDEWVLRSR